MPNFNHIFSWMLILVLFPTCLIAGTIMLFFGLGWWSGLPLLISMFLVFIVHTLENLS